ncbi:hypothetical protein FD35_GL000259 [Furfurilactobacillus rossiae DSM 15814]|uniref:Uncharacterized protein n=1 Tax=Furfurilactobacillus rossiae DSM 15814 TaxID=1114972 RepID=A0A0R1RL76_9LACO|nr:hypothetical protein FD35_GL000259 [Furfurilactobacillus rossiae DSM 15814]
MVVVIVVWYRESAFDTDMVNAGKVLLTTFVTPTVSMAITTNLIDEPSFRFAT